MGKRQKERFIFLSKGLYKEIIELYPKKNDYLFYNQRRSKYNRVVLWKQINEIFMKKTGKDVSPHQLRHWYCTYQISVLKRDIKAVSLTVGHSSANTTLMSYCDTALDPCEAIIRI
jgi:integrase